ncbi:MAG: hypothetical protein RLY14_3213 [Planctomycetota bacterium]|jgi:hypothetical protein
MKPQKLVGHDENMVPEKISPRLPSGGATVDSSLALFIVAAGCMVIFIGLLLALHFMIGFETSVADGDGSVVNLDPLQNRIVGIMISLTAIMVGRIMVGSILISTSVIVHVLQSVANAVNRQS